MWNEQAFFKKINSSSWSLLAPTLTPLPPASLYKRQHLQEQMLSPEIQVCTVTA